MCRTSGRRCPGAGERSTQNTRQAVSRAKAALRTAKQSGDSDQITAARDRLTTARAAHQDAKDATTVHATPGQRGDVTDQHEPPTKDTGMDHQDDKPHGDDHQDQPQRTGFTIHNTNIATGNARVGSQHDVHGNHSDQVADLVGDALRKAAEHAQRATGSGSTRHTVNVASGNDTVAQQVGVQFGTTHVHHTEEPAPQTRDVTPPHTPRSTVTNIVNGTNHGIQADVVSGVTIVNGRITAAHDRDVTADLAGVAENMRQIREHAARLRRNPATSRDTSSHQDNADAEPRSDNGVTITDGAGNTFIQAGSVHGEIWVNGRRVQ
jgi:hypothetical protein